MKQQCQTMQDMLLLYVESMQTGTAELSKHEMNQVKEHLNTCEACQHEKEAIEQNVIRLQSISIPSHSEQLAARCLPSSAKVRRHSFSTVTRYAGSIATVCVLVAIGYLAGTLNQWQSSPTVSSQPLPMNVLFQQQDELIQLLDQQIQLHGVNPQPSNGVTLVGLKQSAYVMQHIYESNSKDVVVSESIRQLTEQNIQLLQSLTQYIENYEEDNAIPMQEI